MEHYLQAVEHTAILTRDALPDDQTTLQRHHLFYADTTEAENPVQLNREVVSGKSLITNHVATSFSNILGEG